MDKQTTDKETLEPTENKTNNSPAEPKKRSKAPIIIIVILSVTILFCISLIIVFVFKNKNLQAAKTESDALYLQAINAKSDTLYFSNYHIEKYDGNPYFVMDGEYKGEYDVQAKDLTKEYEQSSKTIMELYDELDFSRIMFFNEYKDFCQEYGFEQKYNDSDDNYAVFSKTYKGNSPLSMKLAHVEQNNYSATLYVWRDNYDRNSIGDYVSVVIVPVSSKTSDIEVIGLISQQEMSKLNSQDQSSGTSAKDLIRRGLILADKPILYLYPTEETEVSVRLGSPDKLTSSYPKYTENGWHVLAKPSGDLVDLDTGLDLYSLYWEGKGSFGGMTDEGFVVKGEDSAAFLEEKLAILGLNSREREEFILYWLPRLEKSSYNYIRFASEEEMNSYMPLEITPAPDSVVRIGMVFKPLEETIEVKEQSLETPIRSGFTVVEWGGTELVEVLD